jgi:PAS domain S-box-containing protein
VFVDEHRVWSKASRGESQRSVPRASSPAHLALDAADGLLTARADRGPLAAHPAAQRAEPVRQFAAAVIVSPDDQRVGAIELGWTDLRHLDERDHVTLRRIAAHTSRLLELRSEATEYRRFIHLSPDASTVLDLDGCVELANPPLAELLGAEDADALRGRSFLDLVAPGDRSWVAAELARVLFAKRHSSRLDLTLLRLDGSEVRCSVAAGHLRGSRRSLQLVIRDLDERIRAEQERAQLSEQLAQAQRLDLAGRLASGLAHDLKNLVTVMTVNLDMAASTIDGLASGAGDPGHALEDLDQVRIAVDRAGELTTKLMQFARQEPANDEQVDVEGAVDAVRRLVEPSLGAGVTMVVELDDGLPPIAADRVQLEQALVNLVMNSSDASPDGGVIRVRGHRYDTRSPDAHAVRTRRALDPTRDYVCLEVVDEGAGMDDETLTRAFEPLFSTKGAARGTGLGLPTVLAFAQQVDGAVYLDSRPGDGTRATLVLPTSPAAAPTVTDRHQPVAGAKVVLADR